MNADYLINEYSQLAPSEQAKFDFRYSELLKFRLRMRRALKHAAAKKSGLKIKEVA